MRLIDADRLRVDVLSWEKSPNGFSDTYDMARIIDAIDEQPTIEAEPVRRGRWKETSEEEPCYYYCSECGGAFDDEWNYCPNCGAKMEDEE